ncbi:Uncharacterized protein FKW44_024202, partial [Caligus rogercresseyi]
DESWFYWDSVERRQVWAVPTGARFSTPPCEIDSKEDDDSDGVHLQARRVSITALPAGPQPTGTHDRVPKDDWEALSQPEKGQDPAEDCLLMWDNARPHTDTDTREFLTRRDVEPVKQSPYSPDLNLCDRFLFRKLKHRSGGRVWGPRGGYTRRSAGDEEGQ